MNPIIMNVLAVVMCFAWFTLSVAGWKWILKKPEKKCGINNKFSNKLEKRKYSGGIPPCHNPPPPPERPMEEELERFLANIGPLSENSELLADIKRRNAMKKGQT